MHVSRRLRLALQTLDISFSEVRDALIIGEAALVRLDELCAFLTVNERGEAMAAPVVEGGVDHWRLASLETWATRLRTRWLAEASRHLVMHAQPILRAADGSTYAYEALLRSEVGGELIAAGPLLAASSAHGQLRALDALARSTAIRQIYPLLPADVSLFINFAPSVVYNPDICLRTTFEVCRATGADFSRLVFEVTESEAFPDLDVLRGILNRYRREGAQVALDDLGAGHASLTYLEELQPDVVKLDRALVRGIREDDPRCDLIVALVRYAHQLGVRVVVEGIETEREFRVAAQAGADYVQGYLFGRPQRELAGLPADAHAVLFT